jgi:hypothetical protein
VLECFRSNPRAQCIRFVVPYSPVFRGDRLRGALPDIRIDEQDHRKVANYLHARERAEGTRKRELATEPSSTISVDECRDDTRT